MWPFINTVFKFLSVDRGNVLPFHIFFVWWAERRFSYCRFKSRKLSEWSNELLCLCEVITTEISDEEKTPISKISKKNVYVMRVNFMPYTWRKKKSKQLQYKVFAELSEHNTVDLEINSLWKCQSKLKLITSVVFKKIQAENFH